MLTTHKPFSFLSIIFVLLLVGTIAASAYFYTQTQMLRQQLSVEASPSPEDNSTDSDLGLEPPTYTCPSGAWVDCMPGPDAGTRPECQTDYLRWAQANCPGFQGAGL